MVTALVVVDVQNDFVEGGALAVAGGLGVADIILNTLLPAAVVENCPVFFTQDWHIEPGAHFASSTGTEPDYQDSWPDHCVADTEGANFAGGITAPDIRIFRKGQYKASYSGAEGHNGVTDLVTALRMADVDIVGVVGIAYDYCVKATAIDLVKAGFTVEILKEVTASVHPENDGQTTADLRAAGVSLAEA